MGRKNVSPFFQKIIFFSFPFLFFLRNNGFESFHCAFHDCPSSLENAVRVLSHPICLVLFLNDLSKLLRRLNVWIWPFLTSCRYTCELSRISGLTPHGHLGRPIFHLRGRNSLFITLTSAAGLSTASCTPRDGQGPGLPRPYRIWHRCSSNCTTKHSQSCSGS